MSVRPPFDAPVDIRRPHGSFRFDVASPKAGRRITLFGLASLQGWIELEADAGIARLCERPLMIRDAKPQRIVDFWASGPNRSEFVFLIHEGERSGKRPNAFHGAFSTWAAEVGCTIRQIPIERPTAAKERWISAWMEILQTLSAYRPSVTSALTATLKNLLVERRSLEELLKSVECRDHEVVRAAAYLLVYQGSHRFVNLNRPGFRGGSTL